MNCFRFVLYQSKKIFPRKWKCCDITQEFSIFYFPRGNPHTRSPCPWWHFTPSDSRDYMEKVIFLANCKHILHNIKWFFSFLGVQKHFTIGQSWNYLMTAEKVAKSLKCLTFLDQSMNWWIFWPNGHFTLRPDELLLCALPINMAAFISDFPPDFTPCHYLALITFLRERNTETFENEAFSWLNVRFSNLHFFPFLLTVSVTVAV